MGATKNHKKVFLPLRSNMQSPKWWFILIHDESPFGQKMLGFCIWKSFQLLSILLVCNGTECCRPALGWSEVILENRQLCCCLTRTQCTEHFDKIKTCFRRTGTWEKHAIISKVTSTFCTCILTLNNFWITATPFVRSILISKLKPIYLYSISAGFVTTSAFHITCICKIFHYVLLRCIASVRENTLWQTNTAMKNLKTMHPQKSQSIPREM